MSPVTIIVLLIATLFAIYALKNVTPLELVKKIIPPLTPPKKKSP